MGIHSLCSVWCLLLNLFLSLQCSQYKSANQWMLFIILEETPQLPPKVTHKFQQQTLQGRKQTEQTGVVTNIIIFCKLHFLENKLTYKWGTFQHPTWPKIIEIVFRARLSIAKISLPKRKSLLYYLISLKICISLAHL